ncbi:hypothetical protein [Rhodopila sp.]|uniref:hypothetical protein n=1 Tax=Rhodopila sp. TaxID=2480087 RepID=UPI003D12CC6C
MHDWLGVALFALGLGLIVSGVMKRRSRLRAVVAPGAMRPEFAAMGEIVRPIILLFVGIFALKMSLFYFVFGGRKYLTPLDFGALLFVLLSYSGWLIAATTKRKVQAPSTAADSDASGVRSAA